MELAHVRRARERDLVTGIMLGAGLGLTALLLYLDVTSKSTTGATITVMFGSMFAIPPSIIPLALAVGAGALVAVAVLYRPLLLSSLDPELAAVRGVGAVPGRSGDRTASALQEEAYQARGLSATPRMARPCEWPRFRRAA